MSRRAWLVLAAVVLVLTGTAALAGLSRSDSGSSDAGNPAEPDAAEFESAIDDPDHPDFPDPLIETGDLVRLLRPDNIPAIDEPQFQAADEVDWLAGAEPVLSLTLAGETRAYPLQVMTWHEIVNDTVGGVPVAVTYCPLCNSGVAFEREVEDRVLDFGTSGMLYADNLVMYDRQTESLWPQLTGEASVGALTGTKLAAIPMGVVGWDQFRAAHPDSLVLTRDTGHERPYGTNPYTGYDDPDSDLLVPPPTPTDPRLPAKERVVGIELDGDAVAIVRTRLAEDSVVDVRVAGRDLVAWHLPGQRSALDESEIAEGAEIGTVGVFSTTLAGQRLTFTATDAGFHDAQTGSTWNVLGHAVEGPAEGRRLDPVTHLDTFWFAWVAFQPETRLVGE